MQLHNERRVEFLESWAPTSTGMESIPERPDADPTPIAHLVVDSSMAVEDYSWDVREFGVQNAEPLVNAWTDAGDCLLVARPDNDADAQAVAETHDACESPMAGVQDGDEAETQTEVVTLAEDSTQTDFEDHTWITLLLVNIVEAAIDEATPAPVPPASPPAPPPPEPEVGAGQIDIGEEITMEYLRAVSTDDALLAKTIDDLESADVQTQTRAAAVLCNSSFNFPDFIPRLAARPKATALLIQAVAAGKTPNMVEAAAGTLCNIGTAGAEYRRAFLQAGGMVAFQKAFSNPTLQSDEVRLQLAGAIWSNVTGIPENKSGLSKQFFQSLIDCLRSERTDVQGQACGALGNLMVGSKENKAMISSLGAAPILVELVDSPDVVVHTQATVCLGNLAVGNKSNKKLLRAVCPLALGLCMHAAHRSDITNVPSCAEKAMTVTHRRRMQCKL